MKTHLLIASIMLLLSSLAAQAAEPVQTKPGRTHAILGQWHGSLYTMGNEDRVSVINEASHWGLIWKELLREEQPIDFDERLHQAVYIALGVRPTGGYEVEIVRAFEEGTCLVLEYIEHQPAPDRYVLQTLTTPWVMVLLPRTDLRVVIRQANATRAE